MEEGVRSYYDFLTGLTFVLFAIEIVLHARIPRAVGYLMGLFGLFYLLQGWVVGEEGFSPAHGMAQLPAYIFLLAWILWLLISSWRMKEPVEAPAG